MSVRNTTQLNQTIISFINFVYIHMYLIILRIRGVWTMNLYIKIYLTNVSWFALHTNRRKSQLLMKIELGYIYIYIGMIPTYMWQNACHYIYIYMRNSALQYIALRYSKTTFENTMRGENNTKSCQNCVNVLLPGFDYNEIWLTHIEFSIDKTQIRDANSVV